MLPPHTQNPKFTTSLTTAVGYSQPEPPSSPATTPVGGGVKPPPATGNPAPVRKYGFGQYSCVLCRSKEHFTPECPDRTPSSLPETLLSTDIPSNQGQRPITKTGTICHEIIDSLHCQSLSLPSFQCDSRTVCISSLFASSIKTFFWRLYCSSA